MKKLIFALGLLSVGCASEMGWPGDEGYYEDYGYDYGYYDQGGGAYEGGDNFWSTGYGAGNEDANGDGYVCTDSGCVTYGF